MKPDHCKWDKQDCCHNRLPSTITRTLHKYAMGYRAQITFYWQEWTTGAHTLLRVFSKCVGNGCWESGLVSLPIFSWAEWTRSELQKWFKLIRHICTSHLDMLTVATDKKKGWWLAETNKGKTEELKSDTFFSLVIHRQNTCSVHWTEKERFLGYY